MDSEISLCFICLFLLASSPHRVETKKVRMALPGCQDRCGKVHIPFPFGVGDNCSSGGDWYRIQCNRTSNGLAAFLSKTPHQVLDIKIDDNPTIVINTRAITMHCSVPGGSNEVILNLSGSNFFISKRNSFTALGCDGEWLLKNVEPQIVGCRTHCSRSDDHQMKRCKGHKCCQVTLPNDLQEFGVHLPNQSRGCQQAFLKRPDVPLSDIIDKGKKEIAEMTFPVELLWGVENGTSRTSDAVQCRTQPLLSKKIPLTTCHCKRGFEGNPYLPSGCKDSSGNFEKVLSIVLSVSLGFMLIVILTAVTWWSRISVQKNKRMKLKKICFERNGGLILQERLAAIHDNSGRIKMFNSEELDKATDKFSEKRVVGQGSQGTVYKGMLVDGRAIAVKKSKVVDEDNLEVFVNEVVILSQINHRHIVKLLGCCLETDVPMLVYEFVPNGSLFEHLHNPSDDIPMTWKVRLQIATEIAGAIHYLHSLASCPIFHRDIKSLNILLDEKYRSKISDFGISRSLSVEQTHFTATVIGTAGYMDPEYFQTRQFTAKSDVYSFGVVLAELLTGRKPVSVSRPEEDRTLATLFSRSFEQDKLFEVLDTRVLEECVPEHLITLANLTRSCLSMNGKSRPSMREVVAELEDIQSRQTAELGDVGGGSDISVINPDMFRSFSSAWTPTQPSSSASASLEMDLLTPQRTW